MSEVFFGLMLCRDYIMQCIEVYYGNVVVYVLYIEGMPNIMLKFELEWEDMDWLCRFELDLYRC